MAQWVNASEYDFKINRRPSSQIVYLENPQPLFLISLLEPL
jgi:hypothetical protein